MVCERDPASPNDPAEGRIVLVRDGDWLKADGTTLGADDGVAIAAMMALAEDASLPHGPIELLMTVAEEVGLEGANAFDGSLVTGRILVNLDSEEDGKLTVGCAGSTDTWIRVDAPREAPVADAVGLAVTVSGGLGGHSGMNIEYGRSNAVKVLGRALSRHMRPSPSVSSPSWAGRAATRSRAMQRPWCLSRPVASRSCARRSKRRRRRSATRLRRPIRAST
jgi:dipeptidase D